MFKITDEILELNKKAKSVRLDIIKMLTKAKSGHPGGSLSSADIMVALYFKIMRHTPKDPFWKDRDRFYLSKGHVCPAQYAAMAEAGYFSKEELMTLRQLGSRLQGHPHMEKLPGLESSCGSLGQGLSIAVGSALAARIDKQDRRVYCLMGDGETQEGQIWEAAMTAGHYKLDNLCGIVDLNRLQIDGWVKDVKNIECVKDKWKAFNWETIEIDGHDMKQIVTAFEKAKAIKGKPTVILAHTTKGKCVSFMENKAEWHGKAPNEEEAKIAIKDIENYYASMGVQ